MSLVLLDNNAKVGGLVQLRLQSSNPAAKAIFAKVAELNTTWNTCKALIEKGLSAAVKRQVVLLSGNYVRQKAGVVSYHGSSALLGKYIEGGRKGYDAKTGTFWLWVIVK